MRRPSRQKPAIRCLRARVLAALAKGLTLTGQYERGREVAEWAIALAGEVGAVHDQLQGRITLAALTARLEDLDTGHSAVAPMPL